MLTWQQTSGSDASEGLYVKVENEDFVEARFKLVRHDFLQTILDSGTHHLARPVVPNLLAGGADLYSERPLVRWEDLGLRTLGSLEELAEFEPRRFLESME